MSPSRSSRSPWLLAFVLTACLWSRGAEASGNPPLEAWRQQLLEQINQPRFGNAEWGIQVVSLETHQTLFDYQAHKLFQPASNAKLFTAALALAQLGPDYRIRTSVKATASPDAQGVLQGDGIVMGRGDPTFSARWREGDAEQVMQSLVAVFTNAGVRRIAGDLVGDERYLRGLDWGTGWMWEDLEHAYGPRLSALSFGDNTVKLRLTPGSVAGAPCSVFLSSSNPPLSIINRTTTTVRESEEALSARRMLGTDTVILSGQMQLGAEGQLLAVPVAEPAQRFMDHLAVSLQQQGIRLEGKVRVGSPAAAPPIAMVKLGFVESPPLSDMVRVMLKESDNLTAALLFAHVGVHELPDADRSPEKRGVEVLGRFLDGAGLPAREARIEEGSGLSRNSLTTPHALVSLLAYMHDHESATAFTEALPIAGVDGTLKERFHDTVAAGNLRAKTGTLRWAQTLSGYVTSAAGESLAFSILLNRYLPSDSAPTANDEVDALAMLISTLATRSDPQPK